jgi:hypothetical protein
VLSTFIYAQTNVSDSVSGTWNSSGNPYYVTGQCNVAPGNTLTIGPGVEIYFQVDTTFTVQGTLNVNGTEVDSVLFTVDSESTLEFAGIRFLSGSSGSISYARIEYGHAEGGSPNYNGGGIYCTSASLTISHCVIRECSADGLGGGISLNNSSAIIEYSKIYNCSAGYAAGIYVRGGATISGNQIFSNSANNIGGGLSLDGSSSPEIVNNLIYNNSAQNGSGIGCLNGNTGTIINNSIYNNVNTSGGAFCIIGASTAVNSVNNVLWNNSTTPSGSQININSGSITVTYSNVEGGYTGTGNISDDPMFNNPSNADFTFEANSPLVDAGTNTGAPSTDFDGNSRPFDGDRDATPVVDIGAYEYINTVPVITTSAVTSVDEDQPYTYDVDADDPDADETLTYSLAAGPLFLSINSATGEIAGLPDNDDVGNHPVTVVVTDLNGATDTQPFTLTVNQVNDAPVVSNIPDQTIDEGGTFTAIALDSYVDDVDNPDSEITWVASGNVELGVDINPATRVAVITIPNADWNGSETITFTASDLEPLSDSDVAIFTVNSINDPPVVTDIPNQTIDEGAAFVTVNLDDFVSDVDHGDAEMTWTYSGNAELTVNITDRVATIGIPGENWNGTETITFTATDPDDDADNDDATFQVTSINDLPVVTNIPGQTIDEGATFATIALDGYVSDVDHSDAEMTWNATGNTELTVDITARVATISIPDVNWNGSETITFTATDPENGSDSDPATFEVTSQNDAPVVSDIPDQSVDEGGTFATINLDDYVSDVDHSDAEITWSYSGNTDLTVDITDRVATIGIPDVNWNGSEMITFTATDPLGGNNSDGATFEVTSINDPPVVIDIPDQSVDEGATFATINLDDYVSDVDHTDAELTWGYSGNAELTVDIVDRVATIGIPNEDWNGSETITFTATDPLEGTASDAAAFEVISINDAPVVADIPDQSIEEGSGFATINLDDYVSDADHTDDQMTWTYSGNIELTVDITDRVAIIGIPDENWIGIETITFTATDPEDSTDSDAAIFEVNNINDPPVISDIDPQVFNEDESLSYTIAEIMENVHDPDHPDSSLSFMPYSGENVTVSLVEDTLVVFSAPENWNGLDTLTLIVSDGELADSALIYFEVKPVNDTPFFVGLPDTVEMYLMAEEEMNIGDFADDYDFDMPKDSLRWEVSVSDDTLKFDFDPDTKDLTLTAPDYADVFTVFITVTDDSGATAEGSFYVNVTYDPSAIENLENGIPTSYVLKQNYPNPFNPTTHIKFGIPQAGDVLVEVYNLLGQKIVTLFDGYKSAGYHVVDFDASNLPTGIYFYRIKADRFQNVKKMMLVK